MYTYLTEAAAAEHLADLRREAAGVRAARIAKAARRAGHHSGRTPSLPIRRRNVRASVGL